MPWVSQLMFLLAIDEDEWNPTQIREVRKLLNKAVQILTEEDKKEDLN